MSSVAMQRLPHPWTQLGGLTGAAVAMAPGELPRDAAVHVALITVLGLLGGGVGALIGRRTRRGSPTVRARAGAFVLAMYAVLVAAATTWQDSLRHALDMPSLGLVWYATSIAPIALAVVVALAPRIAVVSLATVAAAALGLTPAAAESPGADSRGAAFITTAATPESSRLYAPLDGHSVESRAQDLARRWHAAGGARRGAVVIAVPTGSGWVDPDAIRGIEQRLNGDVAELALQYSDIPSWQAFVTGTDDARRSAVALTRAVARTIDEMPTQSRPEIYLYGQSLGAIGADAARRWAGSNGVPICGTVLAGPPANTVDPAAVGHRVVLANGSDPVVRWSPRLLWAPPERWPGRSDIPQPPWFPVASFVQASADLFGALSFPAGHGHQYGVEQGLSLPTCAGQTSAPRAAS